MSCSDARIYADEIRRFLIDNIKVTGGHLASNLGVVEISLALVRALNLPKDKIVYDTGHQSYVHKLLTGRLGEFSTLRKSGGLSGFTKISESQYDAFGAGHSSTSISAALGIARAARLKGEKIFTVAVIGDGAFTGGMVFEAINNIRKDDSIIIILNENEMSISKNVGAFSSYFGSIRSAKKYIDLKDKSRTALERIPLVGHPIASGISGVKKTVKNVVLRGNFFEELGINYLGPADGNDLETVEALIGEAKRKDGPTLIHLHTKKGKGYIPAEKNPCGYHSLSPQKKSKSVSNGSFSEVFGEKITEIAVHDKNITFVTAAMTEGVGLTAAREKFNDRFFDVGIAEEHAVTFAAGLAAGGALPVFAVYSTFFQRAFDQMMHDIALQNLKVIIALDRAGLVGQDGPTHHGLFDVSLTLPIPNIRIYSPATYRDLENAVCELTARDESGYKVKKAALVRYSKGAERKITSERFFSDTDIEIYIPHGRDSIDSVIITYGRTVANALEASDILLERGITSAVIKIARLKPFDFDSLCRILAPYKNIGLIYLLEEGMKKGGFAEHLAAEILSSEQSISAKRYFIRAVDEAFVAQGVLSEQYSLLQMEPGQIADDIEERLNENR